MRLHDQPLKFSSITHHASVTQCLGSIGGQDWYLGVAKPSIMDGASEQSGPEGRKLLHSRSGHYYLPPDPADVCVFRVSGSKFLKLNKGTTWHAGPLFKADAVDFYNLELSNTNNSGMTEVRYRDHCCQAQLVASGVSQEQAPSWLLSMPGVSGTTILEVIMPYSKAS